MLAQLEIPIETIEYLAQICARENIPFVLDPAPACKLPEAIFKHITWFTPNQTEAVFFTNVAGNEGAFDAQTVARDLLQKGVHGVVLKMGANGALVANSDGSVTNLPAFNVKAIDTTAAGDAFNGGFAVGLMKGMKPAESARFASAVAGISVTRPGAQPSMPTLAEVEKFIAEHQRSI